MKIKKIGQFIKKYSFYLAVGAISVVAIIAMFVIPKGEGDVKDIPNSYADNSQADGNITEPYESNITVSDDNASYQDDEELESNYLEQDEADVDNVETDGLEEDIVEGDTDNTSEEEVTNSSEATDIVENEADVTNVENEDDNTEAENIEAKDVQTETFDSTTVSVTDEPFFADGDKFSWPVEGDIVVPYTDNSTKHWFSESFNYTMRTFGICISSPEESDVVAVAKGRVLEVIDDSSTALHDNTPYIGKTLVIDHGNGYQTIYGFQGGTINSDLVGEIVNEGDVLGKVGSPKGAFVSVGSNIYLQLKHNDEIINPTTYLQSLDNVAEKDESVDVGFSE